MNQPAWMLFVTFGVALLGAVLGLINTWRAVMRDRVQLRVRTVLQTRLGVGVDGRLRLGTSEFANALDALPGGYVGLRITNIGMLEATISNAGFTSSGPLDRRFKSRLRRMPVNAYWDDEQILPRVLKPRESVTVWAAAQSDEGFRKALGRMRRVYVSTDCGIDVFGTSRLFRRLVRRARGGA